MKNIHKTLPDELLWDGISVGWANTWSLGRSLSQSSSSKEPNAPYNEFWNGIKQVVEMESSLANDKSPAEELDRDIEREEIATAIKELKNNKSAGIDNIISEIIKYGGEAVEWLYGSSVEIFQVELISRIGLVD